MSGIDVKRSFRIAARTSQLGGLRAFPGNPYSPAFLVPFCRSAKGRYPPKAFDPKVASTAFREVKLPTRLNFDFRHTPCLAMAPARSGTSPPGAPVLLRPPVGSPTSPTSYARLQRGMRRIGRCEWDPLQLAKLQLAKLRSPRRRHRHAWRRQSL